MRTSKILKAAVMFGGIALLSASAASAAPLSTATGAFASIARAEAASHVTEVRSRRGAAVAAGVAGLIIGGIIAHEAARQGYYPPYPYYYAPYPVYRPYPVYDPAIAYCLRRFRSYDPYSMTYLGHDGFRHPCP